jgi:hypothetical protein
MQDTCSMCGASDFRTSRFRRSDFARLFSFQYPVRCRNCQQREYVFVLRIFKIRRDAKLRHSDALNKRTPPAH